MSRRRHHSNWTRRDHFWNEIIFYPEVEVDLMNLRFHCRKNAGITRQKVPGMFKWEVTPGYWLLKVIWDFFMEPCPELKDEKSTALASPRHYAEHAR